MLLKNILQYFSSEDVCLGILEGKSRFDRTNSCQLTDLCQCFIFGRHNKNCNMSLYFLFLEILYKKDYPRILN